MEKKLEALIHEIMEKYHARGIAIAAVDEKENTLYERYLGYRDEEKKLPITEDTIFGLASISKSFTALCILQLADQGILSLDDPVSMYLPYYKGIVKGKPVRIRHLLTHTGGYYPLKRTCIGPVMEGFKKGELTGDPAFSKELAERGAAIVAAQMDEQSPKLALPGEQMSYCNDGFGLLCEIIRLKGGEDSFASYVKKHILLPLGMTRSNAEFLVNEEDENTAVLYSEKDGISYADKNFYRSAFVLGGGGALKSTIKDFKHYLAMYLNDARTKEGRLISHHAMHEMLRPYIEHAPSAWYCMGLFCRQTEDLNWYSHDGSLPGVSSCFAFSRDTNKAVVVLINTEDVPAGVIAESLLRMLHGKEAAPYKCPHETISWDKDKITEACGLYETKEGSAFTLKADAENELWLERKDSSSQVFPIDQRHLLVKGVYQNSYISLIRDEEGKLTGAKFGSRSFEKIS